MKIQRLAVENFKSFKRLDLELGDFNVFIGANASGKSNVLHVLEFLRDIAASGLRNAVSMQGGVEFLRNVNIGWPRETSVLVNASTSAGSVPGTSTQNGENWHISLDLREARYSLEIGYHTDKNDFELKGDELEMEFDAPSEVIQRGDCFLYAIYRHEGEVFFKPKFESEKISPLLPVIRTSIDPKETILESHYSGASLLRVENEFLHVALYDFDTRAQRKAAPITGKSELEEDGGNVALVLKNLLEDEEKRRRFTNLIQYVLPFVSSVDVERFAGRSLIPTLEETHAPGTPLPASLLSEGTIKVISLLIGLYFEEKPVIAFEEPASNLHPQLISRVVEMMKEQSGKDDGGKQIFVTTHSPEVIKHAGLENVYLVSRDENGFSTVSKPAEKEEVAIFLENEMGLDDLFVQGLLDI